MTSLSSHGCESDGIGRRARLKDLAEKPWGVQGLASARNVPERILHPHDSERCFFKMKPATIIGIVLILLGVVGFALGGFSFTHEKKVVDMGPVQINHQQTKTVPISPALSAIALIGGIGLVVIGARSK